MRFPSLARAGASLKAALRFAGAGGQGMHSQFGWLGGTLPGSQTEWEREAGPLWLNSAVSLCLNWIADNFPEPEIQVTRRRRDKSREVVEPHPLPELVNNPNPFYDGDTLWAATAISYCTHGNGYWIKARGDQGRGAVRELYWVPHWRMEPRWPSDGSEFISHYVYRVDGREQVYLPQDVVHFRFGIDPEQERLGLSRLRALLREVVTDNQASAYTAALLRNMGIPGVVISPRDPQARITAEQAEQLKAKWKAEVTGDRRGAPLVPSGAVTVEKIALSPEEMALDRIRSVPEARICGALRLPAMVVGLNVGDATRTYSNYGEAREAAYEDCLMPMQRRFARTLERQLLSDLGDPEREAVTWCYDQVRALREDQDAVARRAVLLYRGGVVTLNEARTDAGKPAREGGDELLPPKQAAQPGQPGADPAGDDQGNDQPKKGEDE